MSPLEKKRSPNPSLPEDLVLIIVARVSRLHYRTLSLVSKSFRSLLASPELYKTRSLLGKTESCLYVCLQCNPGYRWFTLYRKPDQTLTNDTSKKKSSSGYVLATVPSPRFHKACYSSLVAVGSDIYNIHAPSSSSVSVLDCRYHTWREAPAPRLPVKELLISGSYCEIKNVFYTVCNRMVVWYDNTEPEVRRWRHLEVGELPTFPPGVSVRLADYGGKLAVLWEDDLFHKKKVLCAEIALERRKSGEIVGKLEWLGHVLTILKEYEFVKVLAATV
ncbi:PREDICTED: F-box/kelch-repeat protein At3g08810-like [Camelina sativa]|uniref:F-box/kelch-repeat protein At3g08810-like n=1 Tax=Camelina sativa TaxID=90675 RepID=A0ABM0WAH7_CAMSA|nr:PREDICTED: F-box/kelch-repeat protein At3g08810-like [Camelina sativa]